MYLVVAKMRLLISESISNSAVAVEHSAMEPVHSVSNGMKSAAKPTDWECAAENRQRTVRIAMIESPLIIFLSLCLSLASFLCQVQKFYVIRKRERNGFKEKRQWEMPLGFGSIYGLCHLTVSTNTSKFSFKKNFD